MGGLLRKYLLLTLLLLLVYPFIWTTPAVYGEDGESITARAKIIRMLPEETTTEAIFDDFSVTREYAEAKVLDGVFRGQQIKVVNVIDERMSYNLMIGAGDEILVAVELDEGGNILTAHVYEIVRQRYLIWLVGVFLALLVLIGGRKGLKTILALGLTGLAVVQILLPLLLKGYNPVLLSVGICSGVITLTLLIISGFSRKTLAAIIGTTGGVVTAGMIALSVGSLAKLTGLSEHEAQMLMYIPQGVEFNFRGILFAGIIIGAMGAVMDVGMSIASAMHEIELNKPEICTRDLIRSGMNVGRDLMGTMSNTLILAYTGGSLQLMLLFMAYEVPLAEIVNMDMIASEVVRAMAGSIGLICTIPLTAVAAGTIGRKIQDRQNARSSQAEQDLYR